METYFDDMYIHFNSSLIIGKCLLTHEFEIKGKRMNIMDRAENI